MNVVKFDRRRQPVRPARRDFGTPFIAVLAIVAVCWLGWVLVDQSQPDSQVPQLGGRTSSPTAVQATFSMCGRDRYTCVVDGDTIWYEGQNLRLQSFDTPEPYSQICGGEREVALAKQASARLLQLLNSNSFTVETFGVDGTGERTLAKIRIAGRDVGDILISEGLARRWPDGDEWWCQ